jgi:hypothetical protein
LDLKTKLVLFLPIRKHERSTGQYGLTMRSTYS